MDMEAQKKNFENHVATFKDLGCIKILDFKNPESNNYSIRFLFDEENYQLHITGDLGELIATNKSNMTFNKFYEFINNVAYFRSKINCHSRALWEYDCDKAEERVLEILQEDPVFVSDDYDTVYDAAEDILDGFDIYKGISNRGYEILSDFDNDCWEYVDEIGKVSSGVIELYLLAFKLASDQL